MMDPRTILNGVTDEQIVSSEYDPAFLPGPLKWLAFNVLAPIGPVLGSHAVHEYLPLPGGTAEGSMGSA